MEPQQNLSGLFIIIAVLIVGVLVYFFVPINTNNTTQAPLAKELLIVAFGDSITAGLGLQPEEAYPKVLERALIARGKKVRVVNAGVSGETMADGLRRVGDVVVQNPDIVIVAFGGNDILRKTDPSDVERDLRAIITTLERANIRVVLAGLTAPFYLGPAHVRKFNAIYPALAEEYDLPFVPNLLEYVALDPKMNQEDKIHPNAEGARIIAEENILPEVMRVLDKMK